MAAFDPIQNHVKARDVGQEIHDRVRRELTEWYEASHPTILWHQERLGRPAYDADAPYTPYSWQGENWRVHASGGVDGLLFEVRTDLDLAGVLAAWDDFRTRTGLKAKAPPARTRQGLD